MHHGFTEKEQKKCMTNYVSKNNRWNLPASKSPIASPMSANAVDMTVISTHSGSTRAIAAIANIATLNNSHLFILFTRRPEVKNEAANVLKTGLSNQMALLRRKRRWILISIKQKISHYNTKMTTYSLEILTRENKIIFLDRGGGYCYSFTK